jgi:hypothetical protein
MFLMNPKKGGIVKLITIVLLILCATATLTAQVPNSGFENWLDETTPQDWNTNNFPSFWTTVTRAADSYAGSYAAKLEIADASGFPYPPVLTSTFAVNQEYETVSGYYQFHPMGSDAVFSIYVFFFGDGLLLGTGSVDIENEATSYTYFSFNVTSGSVPPDSATLQMEITASDGNTIGSYALVDQLSLSGASDVEPSNFNPTDFSLKQNYPNPFNPNTIIEFSIPEESFVELKIFDILGKEMATLVADKYTAGTYKADFKAGHLPSGVYIARITVGEFIQTRKMLLLK